MTAWHGVLAVAGFAALAVGGEVVVRGAVLLARRLGLTPLLIGVTIVALGTSAPELAVSLQAAFEARPEVSVGNVVGSNLLNILVVLGISSLIVPLVVSQRLVWWDVPLMIGATVLAFALGADGTLGKIDGLILLAVLAGYLFFAIRFSRRESAAVEREYAEAFDEDEVTSLSWALFLTGIGLTLLVLGADWFVEAAVAMALAFGVSELVVSLTVVAIGTSLPELVTATIAAWRGENDIAVGNVVGSNMMNLLLILGVSASLAPGGLAVPAAVLAFDFPVCLAASVACLPIFWAGHRVERAEGGLFVVAYASYLAVLVFDAIGSPLVGPARNVLFFGVGPASLCVVGWSFWRAHRMPGNSPVEEGRT